MSHLFHLESQIKRKLFKRFADIEKLRIFVRLIIFTTFQKITNTLSGAEEYVIIAYSYGCVIAVESIALFEANGQKIKAIFIDGSLDFVLKPFAQYRENFNIFESEFVESFVQQILGKEMSDEWKVSYVKAIICISYIKEGRPLKLPLSK